MAWNVMSVYNAVDLETVYIYIYIYILRTYLQVTPSAFDDRHLRQIYICHSVQCFVGAGLQISFTSFLKHPFV